MPADFTQALNTVLAELTPQPWEYATPGGTTLTIIPAGLTADPGEAEVMVRITVDKTTAAEAGITTTDLPALIDALSEPITAPWEHQPHYPDGTPKGRVGTWLGDFYGLTLTPAAGGFTLTALEEDDRAVQQTAVDMPEQQRMPLASALRRALDVARDWEQ